MEKEYQELEKDNQELWNEDQGLEKGDHDSGGKVGGGSGLGKGGSQFRK